MGLSPRFLARKHFSTSTPKIAHIFFWEKCYPRTHIYQEKPGKDQEAATQQFYNLLYFSGLGLAITARTRTLLLGLKPRFRLLWMPKDKRCRRCVPGPPRPLFCSSCTAIVRNHVEARLPIEIPAAARADPTGPGTSHPAAPQRSDPGAGRQGARQQFYRAQSSPAKYKGEI